MSFLPAPYLSPVPAPIAGMSHPVSACVIGERIPNPGNKNEHEDEEMLCESYLKKGPDRHDEPLSQSDPEQGLL